MTFYYYVLDENTFITHDGYIQLGFHRMPLNEFLSKTEVEYIETYWIPDTFSNRYKRANFQKHMRAASVGSKTE